MSQPQRHFWVRGEEHDFGGKLKPFLRVHEGSVKELHVGFFPCLHCKRLLSNSHSSSLCGDCADPQHFGFARGVWNALHAP